MVISSPANANTVPLEPNVVIANGVHHPVEVDDTDHVGFDLDVLKEQLGIDSILEKLNDLESTEGVFDPSVVVVAHEVASTNEPHEEEFELPSVSEETEDFGPEVAEVIAQRDVQVPC